MKDFFKTITKANAAGPEGGGEGRLILIVDDSPTETQIFVKILEKAGFSVETAGNGEEGVASAKRLHPDLIIMDVVMPVLNGFQATRQLKKDPETSDIPIIMVTTKDQDTDRTWGMRQGASDYLVKPVNPHELVDRVKAALRG